MKAPIFPVFALKTVKNRVLIGGGGGNEHFGKKNGLVILDETTYKDLDYLETEDIILDLNIYEPGVNDLDLKEDDLNWDEHNESLDKGRDEGNTTIIEGVSGVLYLGCRGTNFFYFVKLENDKLFLIKKVETSVTKQLLTSSLFLIIKKELYSVFDVVKNYHKLDNLTKKKPKADLNEKEEFIYTLYKKNNKILVEGKEGKTEIPQNWENFFISGNRIYKVTKENDLFTFLYRKKKYEYEKEIGDIIVNQGTLIFYLKGVDSQLFFVEDDIETVVDIPKITCMNVEGDYTSVGTADGVGYLFKGGKKVCRCKLCDFAITGISFREGMFYYSSYNGLVDRKPIVSILILFLQVGGVLFIIVAIVLAIIFKK